MAIRLRRILRLYLAVFGGGGNGLLLVHQAVLTFK
jgi:hypothetical protein